MQEFKFASSVPSLERLYEGKTRDTFPTKSPDHLLIVATDRLSTHNVIHQSTVPFKGEVLTALTIFWMNEILTPAGIKHHLVAWGKDVYDYLPVNPAQQYPEDLHLRAIVVKKLTIIPVEFILRDYLCGSLWRDFYSKGLADPYGLKLEPGLPLMHHFKRTLFTPTEKSETDDPLDAGQTGISYPSPTETAVTAFKVVCRHLKMIGLTIIDSKLEIGFDSEGNVIIGDEVFTPDSSRFARTAGIVVGVEPPWLDKELARIKAAEMWNGGLKVPLTFDPETIEKLSETYFLVFQMITGMSLKDFQAENIV